MTILVLAAMAFCGITTLLHLTKLNNCVKGWNAAAHAWIVIADSNVLMPPARRSRGGRQRPLTSSR